MSGSKDWTLIKRDELNGDFHEVECSETEAIEVLSVGMGRLAKSPTSPPIGLLNLLRERVADLDVLGSEITEPQVLVRIVKKIFPSAVRQTFFEDHELFWRKGKIGLRELVGRRLSQCSDPTCDLFYHFSLATFGGSVWPSNSLPELRERTYGSELYRSPPADKKAMKILATSIHVPSQSEEFTIAALELQKELEDAIDLSLSSGRIIVSQETPAGDRFIPPRVAKTLSRDEMDDGYSFLLSSDLPESILGSKTSLPNKRKRAKDWLSRVWDYFLLSERQPSQEDLMTVIQEKFGLTANAAKEVVKGYAKEIEVPVGRIAQRKQVNISEIRGVN